MLHQPCSQGIPLVNWAWRALFMKEEPCERGWRFTNHTSRQMPQLLAKLNSKTNAFNLFLFCLVCDAVKIAPRSATLPTRTSPSGLYSPSSYGPADSIQCSLPASLKMCASATSMPLRFNSLSLTGSCSDCRQNLRPRFSPAV